MADSTLELIGIQIWQISVLFVIVYGMSLLPAVKRRPHLLFLLWVMFFVKCLVPPVVQSPVSLMGGLTPARIDLSFVNDYEISAATSGGRVSQLQGGASATAHATKKEIGYHMSWAGWIARVWGIGSLLVLAWFVLNFFAVQRRIFALVNREGERKLSDDAIENLQLLQEQIGLSDRKIRLVVSKESVGPLVFGFLHPTIVLPNEMLDTKIPLRPVIAHELCHVWRRDHLLGILQIAVQVLYWFHPFVWVASKRLNHVCEICCDEDTVRIFDINSRSYASGLLDVLSLQSVIRPVRMAPGIRPVEVTRKRIQMIVDNHRPKARQGQLVCMCIFLCLTLPASGPEQAVNFAEAAGSEHAIPAVGAVNSAHDETETDLAQRRTEMDFLLGSWDVFGPKGQPAGKSVFQYEESGKMIREDWTAQNGQTAQGITFYDPSESCWKMTWVDSSGTIMESAGQWVDDSLTLSGLLTSKDGQRKKAATQISKLDNGELRIELKIEIDGELRIVSQSRYRRVQR